MAESLFLQTVSRLVFPLLFLLSMLLLLQGYDQPGGGFVGGLLGSSAIILQILSFGPLYARRILPIQPHLLVAFGLLFATASGMWSMTNAEAFMTNIWFEQTIPGIKHLGTALLLDGGVYITVIGFTTSIAIFFAEEAENGPEESSEK